MLGNAGKKLQRMLDLAEELYERMNDLREQLRKMQETVEDTNERVSGIEEEQAANRALLEALADEQDIDVDSVVDEPETE